MDDTIPEANNATLFDDTNVASIINSTAPLPTPTKTSSVSLSYQFHMSASINLQNVLPTRCISATSPKVILSSVNNDSKNEREDQKHQQQPQQDEHQKRFERQLKIVRRVGYGAIFIFVAHALSPLWGTLHRLSASRFIIIHLFCFFETHEIGEVEMIGIERVEDMFESYRSRSKIAPIMMSHRLRTSGGIDFVVKTLTQSLQQRDDYMMNEVEQIRREHQNDDSGVFVLKESQALRNILNNLKTNTANTPELQAIAMLESMCGDPSCIPPLVDAGIVPLLLRTRLHPQYVLPTILAFARDPKGERGIISSQLRRFNDCNWSFLCLIRVHVYLMICHKHKRS